jgi:predicted TPR repeat methyltransferase
VIETHFGLRWIKFGHHNNHLNQRSLDLEPDDPQAHYNLGNALTALGRIEEATICLERATRIAPTFADALKSMAGRPPAFTHALDLGCGTGLSGLPFRTMTRRLTGIDLSENMVAAARKKQVYDDLRVDGVIEFLSATAERYDLVIATDVLIYIGALDELFGLIGRRTLEDAVIVLSTEVTTEANYVLRSSGRYAHRDSYIRRLAGESGFATCLCLPARIRKEAGLWIMGSLFILKKK